MKDIKVKQKEQTEEGWQFKVEVGDNDSETSHLVRVSKDYFANFSNRFSSPQDLVKKSFEFLLEREPKESILKEFDISVIKNYFPEYEKVI